MGLEPTTSAVTGRRSNQLNYQAVTRVYGFKKGLIKALFGGNNRARTYDPLLVRQMLSQLSYAPMLLGSLANNTLTFSALPITSLVRVFRYCGDVSCDLLILHQNGTKVKSFFQKMRNIVLLHKKYKNFIAISPKIHKNNTEPYINGSVLLLFTVRIQVLQQRS